ncbi:MAG: winged helix DNA-binding domain-containing protein [Minicystis sp.]
MSSPRTRAAAKSTAPVLSLRALGRATLARQLLLERAPLSIPAAVARLVGLQAQLPGAPYVGLWSRVAAFTRPDLARLIDERALVRATLLRATLHLATAEDYLAFRPVLQPVLSKALTGLPKERLIGFDLSSFATHARRFLLAGPRTFEALRDELARHHPDLDVRAMGYAVRMRVPLVQVPGKGAWGFAPEPDFALADQWLGKAVGASLDPRDLVLRYLAAFGPATPADAQNWSGLGSLRETFAALRDELVTFTNEEGRELFDLPGAPRPAEDTPAPPRFLPEFDNLMLGHAERARVVPPAFKSQIYLSALRVRATFLLDGMVKGAWKVTRTKKSATLEIEPFVALKKKEKDAVAEEGEELLAFLEEGATTRALQFT